MLSKLVCWVILKETIFMYFGLQLNRLCPILIYDMHGQIIHWPRSGLLHKGKAQPFNCKALGKDV